VNEHVPTFAFPIMVKCRKARGREEVHGIEFSPKKIAQPDWSDFFKIELGHIFNMPTPTNKLHV